MGLLANMANAIVTKAMGSSGSTEQTNFLSGILSFINHPEIGGVGGLVDKFKQAGLGNMASAWVGNGPNPPVTPDQLKQVFSSDQLKAFAQKLGINPDEATSHLADLLPHVVDHLTPDGKIPASGIDMSTALESLKQKLFVS